MLYLWLGADRLTTISKMSWFFTIGVVDEALGQQIKLIIFFTFYDFLINPDVHHAVSNTLSQHCAPICISFFSLLDAENVLKKEGMPH
jgi:hypothetical protein